MVSGYAPAFARLLEVQNPDDVERLSLTHSQVTDLLELCRGLTTQPYALNHPSNRAKLNRLWPFYKVFKENERACAAWETRSRNRVGRTLMSVARAKVSTSWLVAMIREDLPKEANVTVLTFHEVTARQVRENGSEIPSAMNYVIGRVGRIVPGREVISFTDQYQ